MSRLGMGSPSRGVKQFCSPLFVYIKEVQKLKFNKQQIYYKNKDDGRIWEMILILNNLSREIVKLYLYNQMESKQDYFRSPTPKNIQHFYSPFRLLRQDQDPLFINTLLSPLNRNSNSYISQLSPYQPSLGDQQYSNTIKKADAENNKMEKILIFENEEEQNSSSQMATPQKNTIKITNLETTSRKKYDLRFSQSNQKPQFNKDGEKGLRALSKQAYEIFQHSNSMTYQQVAQKIIQQNQQLSEYPQKKKQRQSIKRRVYDALNVLIAAGTLQKMGKKISLSKKMREQNQKQQDKRKDLYQKLQLKIKYLQSKKKRLESVKNQQKNLKKLIARNMKNGDCEQKILLPFVVAKQLCSIKNSHEAKINGFLCGDIDAINKLNI